MESLPTDIIYYFCKQIYNNNLVYCNKYFFSILSKKQLNTELYIINEKICIIPDNIKQITLINNGKIMKSDKLYKLNKVTMINNNYNIKDISKYLTDYILTKTPTSQNNNYLFENDKFSRLTTAKITILLYRLTLHLGNQIRHLEIENSIVVHLFFEEPLILDACLICADKLTLCKNKSIKSKHTIYDDSLDLSMTEVLEFKKHTTPDLTKLNLSHNIESIIFHYYNFDLNLLLSIYPRIRSICVRNLSYTHINEKLRNLNLSYYEKIKLLIDKKMPYKKHLLNDLSEWSHHFDTDIYYFIKSIKNLFQKNINIMKEIEENKYLQKYLAIYELREVSVVNYLTEYTFRKPIIDFIIEKCEFECVTNNLIECLIKHLLDLSKWKQ